MWIYFNLFFFLFFPSSLFSLLSKKHNKVLEQATQSLRGSLGSNDSPLPDYVSIELNVFSKRFKIEVAHPRICKDFSKRGTAKQPPTPKYRNLYEWCHVWNVFWKKINIKITLTNGKTKPQLFPAERLTVPCPLAIREPFVFQDIQIIQLKPLFWRAGLWHPRYVKMPPNDWNRFSKNAGKHFLVSPFWGGSAAVVGTNRYVLNAGIRTVLFSLLSQYPQIGNNFVI